MWYHQGKAIWQAKTKGIILNLTKYESDLAERVYSLFSDYEWLLAYYHERPLQIGKLTFLEISQLRDMFVDPINSDLLDILDFSDFSSEVETSSEGYQDVTPRL